jgi:hypothetical protein
MFSVKLSIMLGAGELMFFSSDWDELEILFGLLAGLCPLFHAGKLMPPVSLERASPFMQRPNRIGVGAIEHLAAVAAHVNEANFEQYAEVLGDGRLRQLKSGDDVVYGALLRYKEAENVATAGFGHGVKGVGGGGGARHERIIFLYRNMSSTFFARLNCRDCGGKAGHMPLTRTARSLRDTNARGLVK